MTEIISDFSGDPIFIKIVSSSVISEDNFHCELRSNIKDAESFNIWLNKFSEKTNCKWVLRSSATSWEGSYNEFSRNYVCKPRIRTDRKRCKKKNTDVQNNVCHASLKVRIKKYTARKRRKDPHLKEGLCAILRLSYLHSHPVNAAEVWNWLKQADEIRGTFVEYFKNGLIPLEAIGYHKNRLLLSNGAETVPDDSVIPPMHWVQCLYKLWKKNNHPANKDASSNKQKELEAQRLAIIQDLDEMQKTSIPEQNLEPESTTAKSSSPNPEVGQETSSSAYVPSVSNFMPILVGSSVKVLRLSGIEPISKPSSAERHSAGKDGAKRKFLPNVFPIGILGRRIISVEYFMKRLKELNKHSDSGCNLNDMFIIHEEKDGLRSCFLIKCAVCYFTTVLWSEEPRNKKKNLNAEAVNGMLAIGGSYLKMQELFKSMSVPLLSKSAFTKECIKIAEEFPDRTEKGLLTKTAEDEPKTVESLENGLLVEHKIEIEEEANDVEDVLSASALSNQNVIPSKESMVIEPDWQPDKVVIKQEVESDVDDKPSSDGSKVESCEKAEETKVLDKAAFRYTSKLEDSSDLLLSAMKRCERIFQRKLSMSSGQNTSVAVGDSRKFSGPYSKHHNRKNIAVNKNVKAYKYSMVQASNKDSLPKVSSTISTSSSKAILGTSNAVFAAGTSSMVFVPGIPNIVFTPGIPNVVFTPGTSNPVFTAETSNPVFRAETSKLVLKQEHPVLNTGTKVFKTGTSSSVFAPASSSTVALPGTSNPLNIKLVIPSPNGQ